MFGRVLNLQRIFNAGLNQMNKSTNVFTSATNFTLTDSIKAEEQSFEAFNTFQYTSGENRKKIKAALLKAIKKSRAKGQTFVSSKYQEIYVKLEFEKQRLCK